VGEETVPGTDPRLARLRQHLAAARAEGRDFSEAWAGGRQLVLTGLTAHQRQDWRVALHATREAWARAYEGQPSTRLDWAATELESFAQDVRANLSVA
jgi:hypothetical protein